MKKKAGRPRFPRSDRHMSENPDGSVSVEMSGGEIVLIDKADSVFVSEFCWCILKNGYPAAAYKGKTMTMHRILLDPDNSNSLHIDHENSNKLDNRRSNLRFCTKGQNEANKFKKEGVSSVYKGVSFDKRGKDYKWACRIKKNGKQICLGYYKTEEEAGLAYDEAAKRLHGDFARLNFPDK